MAFAAMWICMWRINWMRLASPWKWWMKRWMIGGRCALPWVRKDSNKSALLTASLPPRSSHQDQQWYSKSNNKRKSQEWNRFSFESMYVSGWKTYWLCGGPDCGQTYRSSEEEEQGRSVGETLPGGSCAQLLSSQVNVTPCWKVTDLVLVCVPGEEPHLGICQRTDRESNLWLSDKGKHDSADQKLWVQVPFLREVHQGGKKTSHSFWAPPSVWQFPSPAAKLFLSFPPTGNQLWNRREHTQLGEVQSSDTAE